ncbi:MAG: hypothetical protein ACK5OB_02370 [Pirellula sp.]
MNQTSARRLSRPGITRHLGALVATAIALLGIAFVLFVMVRWLLTWCLLWFLGLLAIGAAASQGWMLALEQGDSPSRLQVLMALEASEASSPIASLDPVTRAALVEALAACDEDPDPEVVCRAAALRAEAERP